MENTPLDDVVVLLEKTSADFEPELLSVPEARQWLQSCARVRRLNDFLVTSLAGVVDNASELAEVTGTSIGKAKETVATGKVLGESRELNVAMQHGEVSLDQAAEIARAEESAPGAARELLAVAKEESFAVLKEKARAAKLEAEQHQGLAQRQRAARCGRSHTDPLGMVNLYLRLEPHVGTPIVARAETEARRLYKAAKKKGEQEPFERHLADAYAKLLRGSGKASTTRPELVVLVSYEVVKRGWKDVRKGEFCKIPGVGPVAPEVAREIAEDAFLNGVFYDGKDLRHFKRWSKHRPREIQTALEIGKPPDFDGVKCVDCGNRFRPEFDHIEPRNAEGPTSEPNLGPRCNPCHKEKTKRDRLAGKLKPKKRKPPDP